MPARSLRARFTCAKDMENYFKDQDREQEKRREHMRAEWVIQNRDFNNTMNDMQNLFRFDNM